ncbi:MAG: leucine-rich repeat domain-containing protein, partial [Fibrobacter sp.]|nr:leucine-rich repeat domain-containing protein [Fibrobacter sp.]
MKSTKHLLKIAVFAAIAFLFVFGSCNSPTSNNPSDSSITPADTVFNLDDGVWDSVRVNAAIASIPNNGTAAFTGTLTEEILRYIGFGIKTEFKKITLDLGKCTGLTTLSDTAFKPSRYYLTAITIPDCITSIESAAFSYCIYLTKITVNQANENFKDSNGVLFSKAGDTLFCYPRGKKERSYDIPSGVIIIKDQAFYGCDALTEITIPDGVTSIGEDAFYSCDSLTEITVPEGVSSIGKYAFSFCKNLTKVTISAGVTIINSGTFYSDTNLTVVTIPQSVKTINSTAFSNCIKLDTVKFNGTKAQWESIKIGIDNDNLINAKTILFENLIDTTQTDTSILADAVYNLNDGIWDSARVNAAIASIPDSGTVAFTGTLTDTLLRYMNTAIKTRITNIALDLSSCTGLIALPDSAFRWCNGLTSVTIPDCVTSIGNNAFSGCWKLTSVNIPDGVISIGEAAFESCRKLASITIPKGVTFIGHYAFYYCDELTSVTIPYGVTSIGDYTFYHCSKLTSVSIPSSVTSIGYEAFKQCIGLTSVNIPEGVDTIGQYAFEDCSGLISVTISDGVTCIGKYAFSGCSSLTTVNYTGTEEQWKSIKIGDSNDE